MRNDTQKWSKNGLKLTPKRAEMGPWSESVCCFFSRIEFGNNMVQNDSILTSNFSLKIDEKLTSFLIHFLEPFQGGVVTVFVSETTPEVVPFWR